MLRKTMALIGFTSLFVLGTPFFSQQQVTFLHKDVFAQNMPVPTPQNIIYIMLDDADFSDFGYNNHLIDNPDAVTPNIDKLRAGGKLFANFQSGSAVCSPTRSSVLTGRNPVDFGVIDAWPDRQGVRQANPGLSGLSNKIPQMGTLMKKEGKVTGHYGKWHVGSSRVAYRPPSLGFDRYGKYETYGPGPRTDWSGTYKFITDGPNYVKKVSYIDTHFADMVINFIDQNATEPEGFYLNFWPLTPHYPWTPPEGFNNSETQFDLTSERGNLLAMMYAIDNEVGRIVSKLKEEGIFDETLIVITSDNGGLSRVNNKDSYVRGSKATVFPGGMQVSMVAHWPDGILAGSSNDSVMTTYDLLPTFLDLLGSDKVTEIESVIDGQSQKKAFFSEEEVSHKTLYWEISGGPTRVEDEQAQKTYALRKDEWHIVKLEGRSIHNPKSRPYFLYNMKNDPRAKKNLANTEIEKLEEMKKDLSEARKEQSLVDIVPNKITQKTTIPFDPRFDIGSKDMTLVFDITVPEESIKRVQNLYYKPGTMRASLMPSKQIRWRVLGSDTRSKSRTSVLLSPELSPGRHEIALSVGGFKKDYSRVELYVDGEKVDDLDEREGGPFFWTLWSTVSNPIIGNDTIPMENTRFHLLKLWPEEWQ